MKFIQQAYKGENNWWAYLVTIFMMFFGWQLIGIIPLVAVAYFYASDFTEFSNAALSNFTTLDINSNLYLLLMIFTFFAGLISLLFGVKYIHKRNIISVITSRYKIDWNRFFYAFAVWGIIGLVTFFIDYLMYSDDYVLNFKPLQFFILVIVSFLFLPLQTTMEEVLFRGYLMQGFGTASANKYFGFVFIYIIFCAITFISLNQMYEVEMWLNLFLFIIYILGLVFLKDLKIVKNLLDSKLSYSMLGFFNKGLTPLIITSVIFGLLHGANPEVEKLGWIVMIYYIGTGFLLGILTLMDEGIELSMGFHAANNIIAAVLVTSNWAAFQTDALFLDIAEPIVNFEFFLPFIVFYPLVIFVFSKKYGWTNWKGKLFGTVRKPIVLNEDEFIA